METSSDDDWDSISLTSTIQSVQQEEYLLDGIVAEKTEDGVTKYLAKWHGYPDLRNSWEPAESFVDDTINQWNQEKVHIEEGYQQAFDVVSWETSVALWKDEADRRKERRRAKKLRLGLLVESLTPVESQPLDNFSAQASELDSLYEEANDEQPALGKGPPSPHKSRRHTRRLLSESSEDEYVPVRSQRKTRTRNHSDAVTLPSRRRVAFLSSDEDVPLSARRKNILTESLPTKRTEREEDVAVMSDVEMPDHDGRSAAGDSLMEELHHEAFGVPMETWNKSASPTKAQSSNLSESESSSTNQTSGSEGSEIDDKKIQSTKLNSVSQEVDGNETVRRFSEAQNARGKSSASVPTTPATTVKRLSVPRLPSKLSLNENAKAKFTSTGIARRGPTRLSTTAKPKILGTPASNIYGSLKGRKHEQSPSGPRATSKLKPNQAKFTTFGQRRKSEKASRNERAPNLQDLTLHDPKQSRVVRNKLADLLDEGLQQEDSHQIAKDEKGPGAGAAVLSPRGTSRHEDEPVRILFGGSDVAQTNQGKPTSPTTAVQPSTTATKRAKENLGNASRQSACVSSDVTAISRSAEIPLPTYTYERPLFMETQMGSPTSDGIATTGNLMTCEITNIAENDFRSLSGDGRVGEMKDRGVIAHPLRQPVYAYEPKPMSINHIEGDFHSQYRSLAQKGVITNDKIASDVLGSIFIGEETVKFGTGLFRGLTKAQRDFMLTSRDDTGLFYVRLQQICTAKDYEVYLHNDSPIYFAAAHIMPGRDANERFRSLADILILHDVGAIFAAPRYLMLLYPTGTDRWQFLDQCYPENTLMAPFRFVLRVPIAGLTDAMTPKALRFPSSLLTGESGVSALLRGLFGIEYSKLLPQAANDRDQPSVFFLIWPLTSGKGEYEILIDFLSKHGAKIYSNRIPGSWDYFVKNVKAGSVLIHGSFLDIHLIPQLRAVLQKPVVLFHVNLLPPSEPHLTRLFPYGGAVCLTDSAILYQPLEALRILNWFKGNILQVKAPGTWKLVLRPRFLDWLLDIIQDRSDPDVILVYVQIYGKLLSLCPASSRDGNDDFQTPLDDSDIVSPSELNRYDLQVGIGEKRDDTERITRNDSELVDWFAGWARTKVENIRRFTAVHGASGEEASTKRAQWRNMWGHLHFIRSTDFIGENKVEAWEMDEEKKKQEREEKMKQKNERKPPETSKERVRSVA